MKSAVLVLAGYMVARTLGGAPTLADAIVEQLYKPTDKASSTRTEPGPQNEQEASEMTATIWNEAIWPVERLRQRIFFNFGMEVGGSRFRTLITQLGNEFPALVHEFTALGHIM